MPVSFFYRSLFGGLFFLTILLFHNLYATGDDSISPTLSIKTALTSDFEHGIIAVSITNTSNVPIKVSTQLKISFPPEGYVIPKCLYVCMVFSKKARNHVVFSLEEEESMMSFGGGGMVPLPTEIAPGETKPIQLQLPKYVIKLAKSTGEFNVVLGFDKTVVQNLTFHRNEKGDSHL